ncbi:MAG: hypothetical protein FD177_132 [Desulfovibrionaceae bacterium]|nr:MAG: hypothetical protein FD177_132 [Desulfovibrionaceae bacterium]
MSKTSRIFQTFGGITLAFLVGVAAIAAQDKAASHSGGGDHPQAAKTDPAPAAAAATTSAVPTTYAPGLPGWIKNLPADKQEAARKIWLVDGRVIHASKEMVTAKRHELDALLTLPTSDDKAIAAQVKEIATWEEKLLQAEISLRRKLEKEGIPTWGNFDHGKHNMMMGKGGMMGMMGGKDKDGDASKAGGHSGH